MIVKEVFDRKLPINVGTRICTNAVGMSTTVDPAPYEGKVIEVQLGSHILVLPDGGGIPVEISMANTEGWMTWENEEKLTVLAAWRKGLIKEGVRIRTNANDTILYDATIYKVRDHNFSVQRDDNKLFCAINASNIVADFEILASDVPGGESLGFKSKLTIKLNKGEIEMSIKKVIMETWPKDTEAACVVQDNMPEVTDDFTGKMLLKDHSEDVLEEAKARQKKRRCESVKGKNLTA